MLPLDVFTVSVLFAKDIIEKEGFEERDIAYHEVTTVSDLAILRGSTNGDQLTMDIRITIPDHLTGGIGAIASERPNIAGG